MMQQSESNELLTHLAECLRVRFGEEFGAQIMTTIYREIGGFKIYIPMLSQIAKQERDRRIRATFNGFNHEALAASWGLSVRQVRRIVNSQ